MLPSARRFVTIATSALVVSAAAATISATPAAATLSAPSPSSVANTATAQQVSVTASGLVLLPAMSISGPGGASFNATGVSASGSTVTGTFNLDPNGLPAPPGSYTLTVTCASGCSGDTTTLAVTGVAPHPTSITPSTIATDQGALAVTIAGTGFADGDSVTLRNSSTTVTDPNVVFTPDFAHSSATALKGTLNTSGATVQTDDVVVTATNALSGSCAHCASVVPAPDVIIDSLSAPAVGEGAQNLPETIFGGGFQPGATVVVKTTLGGAASTDVTVSGVSVASSGVINAHLSATPTATTGSRFLVVTNPDGSSASSAITIDAAPKITKVTASPRGQNSVNGTATLDGTGFQPGATVSFGSGVTLDPANGAVNVPNATTAQVLGIDVASDAATGQRPVTIINPDGGSTTSSSASVPSGNQWFFTVVLGPAVTSFSPKSLGLNTASVPFDLAGSFAPNQSAGGVSVTTPDDNNIVFSVASINTTDIKGTVSVGPSTRVGAHDLKLVDSFGGTTTCASCVSVSPFAITGVSPASMTNVAGQQALQVTGSSLTTGHAYTLTMTRNPAVPGQGVVTTDGTATGNTWSSTVNIVDDAPGKYDLKLTDDSNSASFGSCSACFSILPSGALSVAAVSPTHIPAAAITTVTITGQHLFRGAKVSFPAGSGLIPGKTTPHADASGAVLSLSVPVAVDANTPPGSTVNLTLTNAPAGTTADPAQTSTLPKALTIDPAAASKGTHGTMLLLHRTPSHLTFGHLVTLTGELVDASSGKGLNNKSIKLSYVDHRGINHFVATTTTSGGGFYNFSFEPRYSGRYHAHFLGQPATKTAIGYGRSAATAGSTSVASKVSIHFRQHGSRLVISGHVAPGASGHKVTLYRRLHGRRVRVSTARLSSSSRYRFSINNVAPGTYHLLVAIGATSRNAAGASRTLKVVKT